MIKDGEKIENVVPSVWIQNKIVFYPSVFNKIRGCVSKKNVQYSMSHPGENWGQRF